MGAKKSKDEVPNETLVSQQRIALLLGVSTRTIEKWRLVGLPCYKIGKPVRFKVSEVLEWVERHRV